MTVNELIKFTNADNIKFRRIRFFSEEAGAIGLGKTNNWMVKMSWMKVKTYTLQNETLFIKIE